jgi:hypothetical protein
VTQPDPVSTLDIITLVVAIAGLGLAVASLIWQAATFVLSGSRVKIQLKRGFLGSPQGVGPVSRVTAPLDATADHAATMAAQGFHQELLVVDVRNVGRLPVDITSVDGYLSSGWGFSEPGLYNEQLPYRLEPGSKQAWHVPIEYFRKALVMRGIASEEAFMVVGLGTGKAVRTRQRLRIHAA